MKMTISIIGTRVSQTSYQSATNQIKSWALENEGRYICAANVHMLMEAWDDPDFQQILNSADLVTPDGMPLVWMLRLKGEKDQQRVYGPTLMLHVLAMAANGNIPVGFYGGQPEVLEMLVKRMQAKFPTLNVSFEYSPPFRPLSQDEDLEISQKIRESRTRILFVSLGCPKQERWMAEHRNKIPVVMIGVGAAFDFHTGTVRQAPTWTQKAGFEWAYRFLQEPARLWKRYLIHNPRFVILALADLLGIIDNTY